MIGIGDIHRIDNVMTSAKMSGIDDQKDIEEERNINISMRSFDEHYEKLKKNGIFKSLN